MEDFIVILVLLCVVGGVVFYLYRSKKRGDTCVGCPYAKQCGGHCQKNGDKTKTDEET